MRTIWDIVEIFFSKILQRNVRSPGSLLTKKSLYFVRMTIAVYRSNDQWFWKDVINDFCLVWSPIKTNINACELKACVLITEERFISCLSSDCSCKLASLKDFLSNVLLLPAGYIALRGICLWAGMQWVTLLLWQLFHSHYTPFIRKNHFLFGASFFCPSHHLSLNSVMLSSSTSHTLLDLQSR